MTESDALSILLVFLALCGIVLVVASGITLGRKMGDRSYQRAVGINGINQTQTGVSIRTHALRVQLGLVFLFLSVLALIDVGGTFTIWATRGLLCWVLLSYAAAAVWDWRDDDLIMSMQIRERRAIEALRVLESGAAVSMTARDDPSLAEQVP